jgi:hypothetical protein
MYLPLEIGWMGERRQSAVCFQKILDKSDKGSAESAVSAHFRFEDKILYEILKNQSI